MSYLEKLNKIRNHASKRITSGLNDTVIKSFLEIDKNLQAAIESAHKQYLKLREEFSEVFALSEDQQITALQESYVNFYSSDAVNPYVALAAKGPWIVTSCGAILHDSGGYGMLGFGHDPDEITEAMTNHQVMANIMTASFSQKRLVNKLHKEIGSISKRTKIYHSFLCMNSGSEAVTVAARLSDINAKLQTDPGGRHAGKTIKFLALSGGFHGRTDRPAQASDSCLKKYKATLASFAHRDNLVTVTPNDVDELKAVFAKAEQTGVFFEIMFMEPVMGEGDPGKGITPEFYQEARRLTTEHGALLLVDSIQAGLRAHGCLSIMDYPGFENMPAPDMETYSKALNAGQYPFSILAMSEKTAALYQTGIYGNTMTTNPRALDVACAVLDQVDEKLRKNIQERGKEFLTKLSALAKQYPEVITKVQGTGLLFSAEINPQHFKVVGENGLEKHLRHHGLGVIHGGENSLRFTPHFRITSQEVDLMIEVLANAISS